MNFIRGITRKIHPPKYSIGIDFGTTITRISFVNNHQRVVHQPKIRPIKSAICPIKTIEFNKKFDWYVGDQALSLWDCFTKFKLNIGDMKELKLCKQENSNEEIAFRPEILAARIIWLLRQEAREIENKVGNVNDVTITVPAEWNFVQRDATILAAKIAGFKNVNVIEEPIAAFIALSEFYKEKLLHAGMNFLVFDCGGGTLDITVLQRPYLKSLPIVIGRVMDIENVAGEHIDEKLAKRIVGQEFWINLNPREQKKLSHIARHLKEGLNPIDLNTMPSGIGSWPKQLIYENLNFKPNELRLNLDTLNKIIEPSVDIAIDLIKDVLNKTSLHKKEVDKVILVGGSSYLRLLQEKIVDFFKPKEMGKDIILEEPERAVAFGAAMHQSYLDRGSIGFIPTLALDTFLEYEKERVDGHIELEEFYLGKAGTPLRPQIAPKFPEVLSLPKNKKSIHWKVYQQRSYSGKDPEIVEQIKFDDFSPDLFNKLRLEYKIDYNGNLSIWKPRLIGKPHVIPKTGSPRRYDWSDKDPNELAKEYGIRQNGISKTIPDKLKS